MVHTLPHKSNFTQQTNRFLLFHNIKLQCFQTNISNATMFPHWIQYRKSKCKLVCSNGFCTIRQKAYNFSHPNTQAKILNQPLCGETWSELLKASHKCRIVAAIILKIWWPTSTQQTTNLPWTHLNWRKNCVIAHHIWYNRRATRDKS